MQTNNSKEKVRQLQNNLYLTAKKCDSRRFHMLLAMEQRQNEDQRTLGELFFFLVDEMADITFSRSLGILMDALMASLQEILKLSDEQLTAFTTDFEARLPEYLRNALHSKAVAA